MPMPLIITSIFASLLYLIIFSICLINIIKPRLLWEKFEKWKAKKEPSNEFFLARRIGSSIALVIITALMLVPTIMYYLHQ